MDQEIQRRSTRALTLALVGLFLYLSPAFAQTGAVSGVVVDEETGETLIGVNVVLEGTATGAATDLDGHYAIKDVPAGTYDVVFSYIGYNTKTVQGVAVEAGATAQIDISLGTQAVGLDELVVEAAAVRNTEAALLRERAKAAAVSDAISAEAISRSGSGDAAAAMTKVTGASVVGGRYVYIRGLGERYSSTQLNGSELPSADPDRKAFQLDLFPSNLLDNIVTTKTFTPDKPGNFSGGLVNVGTKNFPEAFTLQLSLASSYNTQATFNDNFLTYPGGATDWLGFDDGTRAIPDLLEDPSVEVPTTPTVEVQARRDPALAANLDAISKAFDPVMAPRATEAPINRSYSFAIGDQVDLFGRPLGYSGSLSYGRDFSSYDNGATGRWELVGGSVADIEALTPLRLFGDTLGLDARGTDEVNWGGMSTLSYKPHPNHQVSTTYLRTQSGIAEARYLSGYWQDLSGNSTFETRVLGYKERSLNSLQFRGEHYLDVLTVEWNASFAGNEQDEPDLRYFSDHFTVRERNGGIDTTYQSPASLYPAPTRFFRNLEENNQNFGLDLSVPFRQWGGLSSKLKVGGSYLDVDRTFRERRFEYREGRGVSYTTFDGDEQAYFEASGVVDTTDAGLFVFGNYIIEASAPKNNYDGTNTISAAYAMLDVPLTRRLRFVGGLRFEATRLRTVSQDASLPPGRLTNDDWLPSANVVYQLSESMNLRAAATQTLARPTFRELVPYQTFDFVGDFVFAGNPNLKRTLITNYDLRWEWFVRPGELLAVSGFYKDFQNPLERVILTRVGNNTLSVQNVDRGRVYGTELEVRKRLDDVAPVLRDFQIGGNLSFVHSAVDIPAEELFVIRAADPDAGSTRSLQGQSPYLLNLDLSYENLNTGTVLGLYYNLFGERLMIVTEGAAPDVFERPRTTFDVIASQDLFSRFKLKFTAKNLFDTRVLQSQHFKGQEYVYSEHRQGRVISLGISYVM